MKCFTVDLFDGVIIHKGFLAELLNKLNSKNMENLLEKLLEAVELGKVDKKCPYPPQLKDQGAGAGAVPVPGAVPGAVPGILDANHGKQPRKNS